VQAAAMIVSASYRTDIPTFYGEWFLRRLRAGFCRVRNPYGGPPYSVSLRPDDVDAFVFWTKNVGPFLPALREVRRLGIPFVVQYSLNGYPRELEFSVVDPSRSIEHVRRLSAEYGPRTAVWRYDTIVFSSLTPPEFHLDNFERIARRLAGSVDEVVVSFAQIYRKTRLNMDAAARECGFRWHDPDPEGKIALLRGLSACARSHGMLLSICSQRAYVGEYAADARCIDTRRLSGVAGRAIRAAPKGNRPECGCHESRDIGEYDTCPHGCVYCYAVRSRALAQSRFRSHDPNGEFLFGGPPSK
jgi:hypothetical protein